LKIVHKDLKPENIFLHDSLRQAKIGDFGLAKTLRKRDVSESGATDGPRGSTYTIFGNAGTLYYIAPECFLTGRTTRSADVYAFGVILHNCFITQDEAKTYDARRVLGRGVPSEYSRLFIDQFLNDHLRPAFPSSTKMSPEVADAIIPMIRECLADEDTKVVSPDEKAVGDHQSSRRPKFQDLLPRLDALFDRLKVKKPLTTSEDLPVVSPVSKPVLIFPPAPPADIAPSPSSPVKGLEDALELLKLSQPEMKAPAPSVSAAAAAAAANSPANKGPQAIVAEPMPLTAAVSPPVFEKKTESAAAADSRSPSTSNRTTSSASFRFQPLTALSKIKEELGMDPSVSVKEAIEMAAEDIGMTEELASISKVKEKVEKICEVMGLDQTSFFNPLQTINEKDFKIDLVVKSSMKYELGIKDGLSVIQTLIAYADALGIKDEEFMKLSIKAKAERVAEELGIFSGRTGTMSTTIKASSAL
jgi:serine/threonine protein kinase